MLILRELGARAIEHALLGVMTDEYVRTGQGWRFKQRKLDAARPASR
jgi:hypothetical protein